MRSYKTATIKSISTVFGWSLQTNKAITPVANSEYNNFLLLKEQTASRLLLILHLHCYTRTEIFSLNRIWCVEGQLSSRARVQTPGHLVPVLPTAHSGTRSSCELGGSLMLSTHFWADQSSPSASALPSAKQMIFCPKLARCNLPVTSRYQLLLLQALHCTLFVSWLCNKTRLIYENKTSTSLYHVRGPPKLLHAAESTSSGNSNFSLRFHFSKWGVIQCWTYARHCNKTNTATEALEWESYTSVISIWQRATYSWKTKPKGKIWFQNRAWQTQQ